MNVANLCTHDTETKPIEWIKEVTQEENKGLDFGRYNSAHQAVYTSLLSEMLTEWEPSEKVEILNLSSWLWGPRLSEMWYRLAPPRHPRWIRGEDSLWEGLLPG